jgi:Fic family protein
MVQSKSAKIEQIETPTRIEPARVEEPTEAISDAIAELSATAATLGKALHPRTAANLADVARIMNTYYSNLIEGHNTRPKDIERALAGKFDDDEQRRNLQIEAAAHVRVQVEVDRMYAETGCPSRRRLISSAGCIPNSIAMRRRKCSGSEERAAISI